ncbi:MFS transporter [Bacillus sp. DTU_2020_1000418_1_SI_GHA_SEK_038]|uniref:MFS transporter n=1 Tax=Bacillus sp. DTU_2020_1000418_1_SI_GHA_SEK_038 TaxID=3077585 RepID=UPI0028E92DC7|nr:MFS transporter [Bacillus sp. DTU_2020_1000418_1_SI_GHA_SEK_038]WNS76508.1 MFS transporter [Bacillus sp. DTU_2020_1000418_1_SI_GHA_SEK_038]
MSVISLGSRRVRPNLLIAAVALGVILNPLNTTIMMLSISIFAVIVTPIATRWIEKSGYRIPLISGVIVGVLGVIFLMTINHNSPLYWIFITLSIIGVSNGILNIGLQTILYSLVSRSESGLAAGLFMTSRFIGNILASSLFGVMFATGTTDGNQHSMKIVLLIVSVILLPDMVFVTKYRSARGGETFDAEM